MRINCHAHIFNLQSVFTPKTLDIMLKRLTSWNLPTPVREALEKQFIKAIEAGGKQVDPDDVVARITKAVVDVSGGAEFLKQLKEEKGIEIGGADDLLKLGIEKLWDFARKLSKTLADEEKDASKATLADVLDFVRISLLPSIRHVTREAISQMPPNTGLVALMMDITKDGGDGELLEKQAQDTSDMVLAYPGRMFPFFAVNGNRSDTLERLQRAVMGLGFVGAKLYPSLGYEIDTPRMRDVYKFCEDNDVPMLMHCNRGGFKVDDVWAQQCDPDRWEAILKAFPRLKICFGHFGGAEFMVADPPEPGAWFRKILDLMTRYQGVYADISFNTEEMDGGDREKVYFGRLANWLSDPVFRGRILFGTDYFLVRQRLTDRSYWSYFKKRLTAEHFDQMTLGNPATFLGLPTEFSPVAGKAVARYVQFLARERDHVEVEPAEWVQLALKALGQNDVVFRPLMAGLRWDANSSIHQAVWKLFSSLMMDPTPFSASALVMMTDMRFWIQMRTLEEKPADLVRRQVARELEDAMAAIKAKPAIKAKDVRKKILAAISNAETTLAGMAALCDECFKQ